MGEGELLPGYYIIARVGAAARSGFEYAFILPGGSNAGGDRPLLQWAGTKGEGGGD